MMLIMDMTPKTKARHGQRVLTPLNTKEYTTPLNMNTRIVRRVGRG